MSALPRVKRVEFDWLTQFLAELRNEYGTQWTPFFMKFWFGSNSKVMDLRKFDNELFQEWVFCNENKETATQVLIIT